MRRLFRVSLIILLLCLLVDCGKEKAKEAEPEPVVEIPKDTVETPAVLPTGTIRGRIIYTGTFPNRKAITIDKDVAICGKDTKLSEDIIVSQTNNGIKNVVVSIIDPPQTPLSKGGNGRVLDQRGCWFYPHVQVIPTGTTLEILNSDGILHNIHTFSVKNPPINKAQPGFKKKMTESFDQPEIIRVRCDAHPWMGAWIVAAGHPFFAVTDESGAFQLENVPVGSHTLHFWHEKLGKKLRDVGVSEGEESTVEIRYSEK